MLTCIKVEELEYEINDRYEEYKDKYQFIKLLSDEEKDECFYKKYYYNSEVNILKNTIEDNKEKYDLAKKELF